ncbi:hypothetical protein BDV29DRAFT_199460 [Aspergillus leporis]|uniref:Glucose-methanol-choline oxidoreductase N-terminal domain-containing protein n=1 Tax=Aspergillus leporis TaxID=41062 RepID=A0A5N5X8I3_9EURO|nr:hypothetical protein BDV29DRAFT_199460 [Aspergillus leporis]
MREGCVLVSRLKQGEPSFSNFVIEAGPDVSQHPLVPDGGKFALLLGSEVDWNYHTVPQKHLGGRILSNLAGKALGGSTAIIGDLWADMVGDSRWSYEGLLPYLRKIESHFDPKRDKDVHGYDGPIKTESTVEEPWRAVGVTYNPEMNSGNPIGLAEVVENRVGGMRQMSSSIAARREVIISAGACRTPQLLILSGIGNAEELRHYGINVNPEKGLSIGSPAFNDPSFFKGLPMDFVVTQQVPLDGLRKALVKDDPNLNPNRHPLVCSQRGHVKAYTIYVTSNPANPVVNKDGTHITTAVVCLRDRNPHSAPVIDPNYLATEVDRYMLREGLRKAREVLRDTLADALPLNPTSDDEQLNDLARRRQMTTYHPSDSASMGEVVDSELQVNGIDRLRVVEASVIPMPLATQIQMCIYALAEQAANIILERHQF